MSATTPEPPPFVQSDDDYLRERIRQACDRGRCGVRWSVRDIEAVRNVLDRLRGVGEEMAA